MLIDSHAHLNFQAFENDFDEVIKRSLAENVWLINAGSNYETSKKAVEIAEKYPEGVYAAIGLHPIHARDEDFVQKKYKELAKSDKVVAIGEIGLDYYKDYGLFKEKQRTVLCEQLDLAEELNLPVIFHCRKAHRDLINIIFNFQFSISNKFPISNFQLRGVVHCFTGTWEQAKKYLDTGFYLGFNGIIYKFYPVKSAINGVPLKAGQFNRVNLKEAIKKTPLGKILIETDCPYLTPPEAGLERNEPIFVKYIVQEIAKIKGIDFQTVADTTTKNAKNLFNP